MNDIQKGFFLLTYIIATLTGCCAQNRTSVESLYTSIMRSYNRYVRPDVDQSAATNVRVDLEIMSLRDLDEVKGLFSVVTFLKTTWLDSRMTWSPSDYDGLEDIEFPQSEVWRPELTLANPYGSLSQLGYKDLLVKYKYDGSAEWIVGDVLDATCDIEVTYFPFDQQNCSLYFLVWGYLKTQLYLSPKSDTTNMNSFTENGIWIVDKTKADIVNVDLPYIRYEFYLTRRSTYFVVNVYVPVILLTVLSTIVFFLPADSGERVGYSITCLLSIAVFLTIVSDNLPNSSKPVSILGFFLMLDLILATALSVLTILGLRLYHKEGDKVPQFLQKIVLCFTRCRKKPKINPEKHDITSGRGNKDFQEDNLDDLHPKSVTWRDVARVYDITCFILGNVAILILMVVYLMVSSLLS